VLFGLCESQYNRLRRDHSTFYCPNGHPRKFMHESDVERERRLRKEAENRAVAERAARDRAEAEAKDMRTQLGTLRKRTAAGVCPCCHRTFRQLATHMKTKHPRFKP